MWPTLTGCGSNALQDPTPAGITDIELGHVALLTQISWNSPEFVIPVTVPNMFFSAKCVYGYFMLT